MSFKKAQRKNVWTKTLLAGSSGSGKSYTALRLATGLASKCDSRIAVIDTEAGRINYYADEFDFDSVEFTEFKPETYTAAINEAIDAGYKIIIIDSMTHEWDYCLEEHSKMPGNSYTNWGKITPRHDAFMESILQCPAHVICTVRGKDEYVLEEKNGKQQPKKVGLGYKQRDNTEYNFTVTFNLAQDTHIADATKDNTHIFEGRYDVLTEKDGEKLWQWANSSDIPADTPTETKFSAPVETLESVIEKIAIKVKELTTNGVERATIGGAIKEICGTANYKSVNDVATANKILEKLGAIN